MKHPVNDPFPPLKVGDKVEKITGYPFPGVVVSLFTTLTGQPRFVVECTVEGVEGCLHIFSRTQLKHRTTP